MTPDKNLDRKSNSRGFHAGQVPEKFSPDDVVKGTGGEKNKIGATSEPNTHKNKTYDKSVKTPRDVSLNAVPMPNKDKGNTKNYGIFSKISTNKVNGTPKPNTIS